jgi:hypothetical protein
MSQLHVIRGEPRGVLKTFIETGRLVNPRVVNERTKAFSVTIPENVMREFHDAIEELRPFMRINRRTATAGALRRETEMMRELARDFRAARECSR